MAEQVFGYLLLFLHGERIYRVCLVLWKQVSVDFHADIYVGWLSIVAFAILEVEHP